MNKYIAVVLFSEAHVTYEAHYEADITYKLCEDGTYGAKTNNSYGECIHIYTSIDKLFKKLTYLRGVIKEKEESDYKEFLKKEASVLSDALEEWRDIKGE